MSTPSPTSPSSAGFSDAQTQLSATLRALSARLPETLTVRELMQACGEQGLLLFCCILTFPFLLPVSIPGVSTVFGALIVLIGIGVTLNRMPWVPRKLLDKSLTRASLAPALDKGADVFTKYVDRLSKPRLLALTHGSSTNRFNGFMLFAAGVLLMAPFGLIPFSNTLPALAALFFAIGILQRDGYCILLGHGMTLGTIVYFSALIYGAIQGGRGLASLFGG
ncbi:exopolysaccharide biosynthesis protein [Pyxidicoccus fallax]|uniref:Exopolysaccharide biosynthesis protein n=1 Tax=Pyxidicoccus fallax TaxID=394095 RepID=A0A848LPL2_9BACT|nr:exopolysaccharide biosynthesis protein [Pyxidicoccus fallax]NMO19609.1 exopolysaccharide biosynthesis protein [Pyxidicoccus fallax]NPC79066.1 exopolysaccharide biosynthesis protein [Pyxidicoccus fallax]